MVTHRPIESSLVHYALGEGDGDGDCGLGAGDGQCDHVDGYGVGAQAGRRPGPDGLGVEALASPASRCGPGPPRCRAFEPR
jgi:hypothetical protein